MTFLERETRQMKAKLAHIRKLLASSGASPAKSRFRPVMGEFATGAADALSALEERLAGAAAAAKELGAHFGEQVRVCFCARARVSTVPFQQVVLKVPSWLSRVAPFLRLTGAQVQ